MSMKIYIEYKLHLLKRFFETEPFKIRFWWQIYTAIFFATTILYSLYPSPFYIWGMFLSFTFMVLITTVKDYRSGAHIGWMRKKRKEELKWKMKTKK